MATLVQQQKILAKLANKATFDAMIDKAATPDTEEAKNEIIRLNKKQLSEGENNLGNLIGRYAEATEYYARSEGIAGKYKDEPYDFQWTGAFFEAFRVKTLQGANDVFEITSDVSYLREIQKLGSRNRAQGKVFGLTPENKRKYVNRFVKPNIMKSVKAMFR